MIAPQSAKADLGPCDKDNAACITRKALEFKYKADALQQENDLLRQELKEEQDRNQSGGTVFILGGVVFLAFFGSFFAAYQKLR
jgi:hypothetical protein